MTTIVSKQEGDMQDLAKKMAEQEGLYLLVDSAAPNIKTPIWSQAGFLYSLKVDQRLSPEGWRKGEVTVVGPMDDTPL